MTTISPHNCLLCIGSNHCPDVNIPKAVAALTDLFPGIVWSPVIVSPAHGVATPVPHYHNRVARFTTTLTPADLRTRFKKIETSCGRTPASKSTGLVPLDIDLLQYDDTVLKPEDMNTKYVRKGVRTLSLILTFILLLIPFLHSGAQDIRRNLSYGICIERGCLIPGDKFAKELIRANGFGSLNLNVTFRADSTTATPYDISFGYPGIEAGILIADYTRTTLGRPNRDHTSRIGYILGIYGKFNRDLLNTGAFRIGYSISNGIGYCPHPYSWPDNIDNEFIGTPFTIYFATGLYTAWRFHPRFELHLKGGLRHFSNSALGRPNKGANTVGLTLGMRYYPYADETPRYRLYNKTAPERNLYFDLSAGCNLHTMIETWYMHQSSPSSVPARFPVRPSFATSLAAMYRYHLKFSSGISLDYMYAGYYAEASRIDSGKGITGYSYSPHVLGVSLRHEVRYRRIGFGIGFGWYLHRHLGQMGKIMCKPYYETIGLRYYLPSTPLYLSYNVHAHLLRADAMQFNLGICL